MLFNTCPAPCNNPPGQIQGIFLHWIQGQAGNVGTTPVRVDAVDRDDLPFTHAGWYEVNTGGQPYPLRNTWQCLEYHIKINTRAGADNSGQGGDGIIEGWTDGIQRFNYPNASQTMGASGSTAPNDILRFTLSGSGNIYSPPSGITTHRYVDNIVMSTARIGCLGSSPTAPAAPTNLKGCINPPCIPIAFDQWLRRIWAWLVPTWA
jgi:hypothetical protein